MKLFVDMENDTGFADEFLMAKAVFDLCVRLNLCEETVAKMILLQTEKEARDFSTYMNRPEVKLDGISKEV